ncbi:MAG: galactitol-1-phosphate 5-dehydrogenase [Planctomycetota bacterium]|jgi:L-iditol 2-dehydrogenase
MKALVLTEYLKFEYLDIPEPDLRDDDVLVKVQACGICGSDVHGMDGSTGRRQPPIVMGHEAAGVIARAGSNVTDWKQGDRVTFDSTVYCGQCWFCHKGLINLCDNRRVLGVSCDHYRRHGAFAEHVAIPQHILYALPDKVTFTQAAMVEAFSIAFHAVGRTPISRNDTAVVVGAGMIGLLVIQSLRTAGCGKIIAVDLDQDKLDLALNLGADISLKPNSTDVKQAILDVTENRGADIAFEAVGISTTVSTAIEALRKGGSLTLVGNLSPRVDFPLQLAVTRQISIYGSCASSGEYPTCLDMIADGRINVDALISAIAPLAEGAAWFKRLYDRQAGLMKVILTP